MTILLVDQIAAVRDAIDWESMSTYSPERVPALRAALATLEASAWRPIKTAPRDEEVYLLACTAGAKLCGVLGWDEGEGEFYWLNGMFRKESKPTHWRPLPEPPDA